MMVGFSVANIKQSDGRDQYHNVIYSVMFPNLPYQGKVLPYSLLSAGPGADLGVQEVNPQVTF